MNPQQHYRAVFLSPHLDDAVFCCGGEIAKLRQEGPILVINIFTKFKSDSSKGPDVDWSTRYSEEDAAAKVLGYEYINLDECDAFLRHPRYQNFGNIFRRLVDEEFNYLETIKKILFEELGKITFDRIYVPLGIGWHVDHCLTYLAMQDFRSKEKILFYEDTPYCFIETATDSRFYQMNTKTESFFKFLKRWGKASVSFYQSGMVQTMEPAWQRLFAFPFVSIYLFGMMKGHLYPKVQIPAIDSTPIFSDISDFFDLKMKAMNSYASQVIKFFISTEEMRTQYLAHSTRLGFKGKIVERYWKAKL